MISNLLSLPTLIRFAETFVAVLASEFVLTITTGGTIDLASSEGLAAILAALSASVLLALRRAWAVANQPMDTKPPLNGGIG